MTTPENGHESLDRLQTAIDEASKISNLRYSAFLSVTIYSLALVQQIGPQHLLEVSDVQLTGLNIGVNLLVFFWTIPFAVFLLHMDALRHHYLLGRKIAQLEAALRRRKESGWRRGVAAPFFLVDLLLSRHLNSFMQGLGAVFLAITLLILPVFALLFVQIKFLPYHDKLISGWHTVLILVDVGIQAYVLRRFFRDILDNLISPAVTRKGDIDRRSLVIPLYLIPITMAFLSLIARVPDEKPICMAWPLDRWTDCISERRLNLPGGILAKRKPANEIVAAYLTNQPLISADDRARKFKEALREHSEGLDLAGRDLRWANFNNATFLNVDLSGAVLDGATMVGSHLFGAKLSKSLLRHTDLSGAKLAGVEARETLFHGTNLKSTDISGSDLANARFIGTYAPHVNMTASTLHNAMFIATNMRESILDGADISKALFIGSDMDSASLQNATIGYAVFQYSILRNIRSDTDIYRNIIMASNNSFYLTNDMKDNFEKRIYRAKEHMMTINYYEFPSVSTSFVDKNSIFFPRYNLEPQSDEDVVFARQVFSQIQAGIACDFPLTLDVILYYSAIGGDVSRAILDEGCVLLRMLPISFKDAVDNRRVFPFSPWN